MKKHLIQREIDRVNNVVWETLKRIWIIDEFLKDDLDCEKFYTPPKSPR
jgi:hypothetical protein